MSETDQQLVAGLDALTERARALVRPGGRQLLGITGSPGAGKTTLATKLVETLNGGADPQVAVYLPMDGFHLADASLQRLGLSDRKGAPETFDGHGYLALLRRVRVDRTTVWAPGFERDLEQPIAGAIAVDPDVRLVVTEGNYLLIDADPWREARSLLDQAWFVEVDDAVRRDRLVARHVEFGKARQDAIDWVQRVDEPNARLVAASRSRADLLVTG
ncbi:MAG: nucleoside/nucleotide kinase family protein [Actinobacteria bacterium]|nr:nucleoside/nucleotide kinase family protein [Actinomycetota bacterium]